MSGLNPIAQSMHHRPFVSCLNPIAQSVHHTVCVWFKSHCTVAGGMFHEQSHMLVIRGNEKADFTFDLPHVKVGVPYSDFKLHISQYIG